MDRDDIVTGIVIVAIIATIIALPLIAGWFLWGILAPATFWETVGAIILEIVVLGALYTVELIILIMLAVFSN